MAVFEEIREKLNTKITARANEIIPDAVGDKWRNENFTALFPGKGLSFLQPSLYEDNDWVGITGLEGDCVVRILTDEFSPVDPTPLIASLFLQPIFIDPEPTNYNAGDIAFSLVWKATNLQDLLSQPIITVVSGPVTNGYMLQRKEIKEIYDVPDESLVINKIHSNGL